MEIARIPFDYFAGKIVSVPARLDDSTPARLLFDTGSGLTTISTSMLTRLGRQATDPPHTGKRMSGQDLSVPMATLGSLSLGPHRRENVAVGSFDMSALLSGERSIDGILSLGYFDRTPVTEDHHTRTLTIESDDSLRQRSAEGKEIRVEVEREGPTLAMFLKIRLPSGGLARVEVDTGSQALILHERYMVELGVGRDGPDVRTIRGLDETGHRYVRFGARLPGEISPAEAPEFSQSNSDVIFQNIIYDGLIGLGFLRRFITTYDVRNSRIILARPPSPPSDRGMPGNGHPLPGAGET